jgi:hypothetical protein
MEIYLHSPIRLYGVYTDFTYTAPNPRTQIFLEMQRSLRQHFA